MRVVGALNRSAFEPDPCKAWRRARLLDTLLHGAGPRRAPGVTRLTHEMMMRRDEARMFEVARRVNGG